MKWIKKLKLIIILLILTTCFILLFKMGLPKAIETSNMQSIEYKILVDVEESRLYLFENGELSKTYKCSGGKQSTPSPIGTWKIISKAKWGEGFGRKFYGVKCSLGSISVYMVL